MSATPDSGLEQRIADLERQLAERDAALAERTAERDEALEQQTATAEVLQVINSSPGDLTPVFEAMLEKAVKLCEADYGALRTFDGELFHLVAAATDQEAGEALRKHGPIRATGVFSRIARGEPVVHMLDAREHEDYRDDPATRERVDLRGIRTWLAIALRKDDSVLGFIAIYRQEVRPFTDKQIALLQNFAAQAVIAMENARLLGELRQRTGDLEEALEQQTATAEVLQVINSSPGNLGPVFDAMLEKATGLCEADFGILLTYEEGGYRAAALRNVPPAYADALREPMRPGPKTALARVARGEPVAQIVDIAADKELLSEPMVRGALEIAGFRTVLAVPLRQEGKLLGAFTIYRQQVRPFSDKQIAFLQNFAAQAVIAIENARLMTETRESLDQQTATAEVLGVINASPGDLKVVWDAMLEKAARLCEAKIGVLWMHNGELMNAVAALGAPPAYAKFLADGPYKASSQSHQRLRRGDGYSHVLDISTGTNYRSGDPTHRAVADLGGVRTALLMPLRKDSTILGHFSIYRQEVRSFTDKQIALLENFAAQAVIAMENARLMAETREALEQQTATVKVLGVINSSPGDLAPVFDTILEKALALSEASYGGLSTYDGKRFHVMTRRGATPEYLDFIRTYTAPPLSPNSGLGRIARGERIVHIVDIADDDLYRAGDPLRVATVDLLGGRTCVWVALHKEGRLLGMLNAYRRQVRPFTDKQIALLQNFAAQAVIAIENARLLGELRQRTDDVQEALEYQTAISDVLKVISRSTFDLQPVLDTLCETAARLCDASTARIALQRENSYRYVSSFVGRAISPQWDAMVQELRFTAGHGTITGRALLERQTVHVADIAAYPEHALPETFTVGGIRTMLAVPLLREDELIGVITLSRTKVDPFTDRQIELVRTFADQAVIAIENARLLGELRQRTDEVAELNRGLEARVAEQVDELGRVGRLKRFLAPQLAELIVSHGDEKILESHRREIVVVFCDLRGYTAFTETAEPEEVLEFLRRYHGALGPLVTQFEGTLDQFSGDGIMVFFNDPVPCPDPAERAVKMAMAMREAAGKLIADWSRHGCELGFGAGIAQGYATLGQIGFSDRSGYTAIGTVCNLASRLCAEAKDGQILVSSRIAEAVKAVAKLEDLGNLDLRGLRRPVAAFNVVQSTSAPDVRPNLTVVANEPGA